MPDQRMTALEQLVAAAATSTDSTLQTLAREVGPTVLAHIEQRHDNDQVRRLHSDGVCPTCGREDIGPGW